MCLYHVAICCFFREGGGGEELIVEVGERGNSEKQCGPVSDNSDLDLH